MIIPRVSECWFSVGGDAEAQPAAGGQQGPGQHGQHDDEEDGDQAQPRPGAHVHAAPHSPRLQCLF